MDLTNCRANIQLWSVCGDATASLSGERDAHAPSTMWLVVQGLGTIYRLHWFDVMCKNADGERIAFPALTTGVGTRQHAQVIKPFFFYLYRLVSPVSRQPCQLSKVKRLDPE